VAVLQRRDHIVCAVAAIAQIFTLRWTWDLWTQRSTPPNLPLVDALSFISWGPLLVALCIATVVRPRWGAPAFVVALAVACLGDQMRLQPGVVSVAILMTAPAFGDSGRAIARWYLCSLWLWAGLNKLLSSGWAEGDATFIAESLGRPGVSGAVTVVLPLIEVGLGLTALWPRLWNATAVGAVLLHVGVVVTLSPLFGDWNSSVWPWNAAIAIAAPLLFLRRSEDSLFPSRPIVVGAAVLLAYPALFYVGVGDTYLTHNLYASNSATAQICPSSGDKCANDAFFTWGELNVPFPPEPRLFRQAFYVVCAPADRLVIIGRQTRFDSTPSRETVTCGDE
jgi:hypothetical protein